jgi:glycosyltransferase involved in cell wall biosynthesis
VSQKSRDISVAVFHPRLGFGGSEAFAMWTLEALKHDYRIALVAGGRIDLPALNAFYGTSIDEGECETVEVPIPWPLDKGDWGAALRGAFVERGMRQHVGRFDVALSAYNIARFGRPALHHLADFSWDESVRRNLDPSPSGLRGVFHKIRFLRKGYLGISTMISGGQDADTSYDRGLVLANSHWSKELLRRRFRIESRVLYPPVMMSAPRVAPDKKVRRFVCLGRIYPEKRIEVAIQILKAVRARDHRDLKLHIIGDTSETTYGRHIEKIARAEDDWVVLEGRQFGEAKARVLSESAFAIHARPGEAFGIAVAEMITAGCIPFVPAEGGPAEIVESHPALLYRTPEEAVDRIIAVLADRDLEASLRGYLDERAKVFSRESFICGIRGAMAQFVEDRMSSSALIQSQVS